MTGRRGSENPRDVSPRFLAGDRAIDPVNALSRDPKCESFRSVYPWSH